MDENASMKRVSVAGAVAVTFLVIVAAMIADLFVLAPVLGYIFLSVSWLPFWLGVAALSLPKLVLYGFVAWLGFRCLAARYGNIPGWVFALCFEAFWALLHWGQNWSGDGWIALFVTYSTLLSAPAGIAFGAWLASMGPPRPTSAW